MMLPDGNGSEIWRCLKENTFTKDIPVVMEELNRVIRDYSFLTDEAFVRTFMNK